MARHNGRLLVRDRHWQLVRDLEGRDLEHLGKVLRTAEASSQSAQAFRTCLIHADRHAAALDPNRHTVLYVRYAALNLNHTQQSSPAALMQPHETCES
eukprot:758108-Prymnesium_polylepis.1